MAVTGHKAPWRGMWRSKGIVQKVNLQSGQLSRTRNTLLKDPTYRNAASSSQPILGHPSLHQEPGRDL